MLMDKLSSGADFAQLAMDYSEDPKTALTGGDLGYIPESVLDGADPTLKEALLTLKVGQASQPIQARDSIRILKLAALAPAGQHDLSDPSVKETIRQILLGQESGTSQQKP
jgi:peptidyl-prolyl cis-trans isomerase SurA